MATKDEKTRKKVEAKDSKTGKRKPKEITRILKEVKKLDAVLIKQLIEEIKLLQKENLQPTIDKLKKELDELEQLKTI
jgi:hypothetical protein